VTRTRRILGYTSASMATVAVLTGGLWPWVGSAARDGLLSAAMLALVFQVPAFALLVWIQDKPQGFLLGLAGGMLARMGLVAVVAVVATAGGARRPWTVAMVLGLVGYLFVLVLLEAWFIRDQANSRERTQPTS